MKNKLLLLAFTALLFASCSKENNTITSVISDDQASMAKKGPQARPFTGSMTYSFAPNENLPCDCGDFFPIGTYSGTGNLSHLGKTSSLIKPCVGPLLQEGNLVGNHVGIECAYFVAANGDSLYCFTYPYDLFFTPVGAVGVATVDFVGGTGRFKNATGTFTGKVTVGQNTATFTNLNGTITY